MVRKGAFASLFLSKVRNFFSRLGGTVGRFVFLSLLKKGSLKKRILASTLAVTVIVCNLVIIFRPKPVLGQTYNLVQNDWSGGISPDAPNATAASTGWTKYSTATGVVAGGNSITMAQSQASASETFTTNFNKDAAHTTANWNTSTGNVEIPSNVVSDYSTAIFGYLNGTNVSAEIFDSIHGMVYIGSSGGKILRYSVAADTVVDLTVSSGFSVFWGSTSIISMAIDQAASSLYIGGSSGKFAVYSIATGTATDLRTTTGFSDIWGTGNLVDMIYDGASSLLYLGGGSGYFAVYNPGSPGTVTNLTNTSGLSAFWGAYAVNGLALDTTNHKIYMGGANGLFAVYTPGSPGTAVNLTTTSGLSSFWGTSPIFAMAFNSTNGKIYLGYDYTHFASYTPGSPGTAANLANTGLSAFWSVSAGIYKLAHSSAVNKIYIMGGEGKFAVYNPGSPGTTDDITSSSGLNSFFGTNQIGAVCYDTGSGKLYIGGNRGKLAQFTPGNPGTAADLTAKINGVSINGTITPAIADQSTKIIYFAGPSFFGSYNVQSGVASNLTSATGLSAFWPTSAVNAMVQDPVSKKIYIGGQNGTFAVYTPGNPGSFTDLTTTSGLNSFWGGNPIYSLLFDSVNSKVYIGGSSGLFAVYTPGSPGTAVNLTTTSGLSAFWSGATVWSLGFDAANAKVYLGSTSGLFAVYTPGSPGTAVNLTTTSGLSAFWSTGAIYSIVHYPVTGTMYLVGQGGRFAAYAPGSPGTAIDIKTDSGLAAWNGTSNLASAYYDSYNGKIYIGSSTGKTGEYTPGNPGVAANATALYGLSSYTPSSTRWIGWVNGNLYFLGSNQFMGVQTFSLESYDAVSLAVDSTEQYIKSATLSAAATPGNGTVSYYLSNDGLNFSQVTPSSLYSFATSGSDLRFKITITGDAYVSDVSITYDFYPASASLVSSKFDGMDPTTVVNRLIWDENQNLPVGTGVTVSLRTAADASGLTGAWTNFTRSAPCSKTGTTVTCGSGAVPASMQDGSSDRWFQYQVTLSSDGRNAPTVNSAAIQFVVNAPPEVRNVTAVQNASGTVTISYEVRDSDTAGGSPANSGYITPSFEYWNGSAYQTISSLAAGDGSRKAVNMDGTSWSAYTATWNPAADFPNHYLGSSSKIRVTANDGEAANATAAAESAAFTLDTATPTGNSIYIDASTVPATVHLSSADDSTLAMKVSATDSSLASVSAEPYSATKTMTLAEGATVYAKFIDAYGNSSNILSATVPSAPGSAIIHDISNTSSSPAVYRFFIAWKPVTGAFSAYKIYRSTSSANPENWPLLATITSQSANYYIDNDVSDGSNYFYYIKNTTSDNSSSFRSATLNGVADGYVSGSESGGGGPASPPVITGVSAGTPVSTQATITWETDTLSDSKVEYSSTPGAYSNSVTISSLVNNSSGVGAHSVIISGLSPSTTYYFRVHSANVDGQSSTDDNAGQGYSFTTPQGPVISGTAVERVTNTTATVSWRTDVPASTVIVYSIHADLVDPSITSGTTAPSTDHSISVNNLTPGSMYFFYVRSVDGSSNETTDKRVINGEVQYYSFTTTDDRVAPSISNIRVKALPTSADIIWTTSEPSDSQVEYGLTTAYGTATSVDEVATSQHIVTLSGLTPQTVYNFRVRSRDVNANPAVSLNQSFTTPSEADTAPPSISEVTVAALTLTGANITWSTNEPATTFVEYGRTVGLGQSAGDVTNRVLSHELELQGLEPNQQYYFRVRSEDAAANIATDDNDGELYTFTTAADVTPPEISNVASLPLLNSATITWTTSELADSQVEYGTSASYGLTTAADSTLTIQHSVTITGLSAGTQYHFRIITKDMGGNPAQASDGTFTTLVAPDTQAPAISAVSSAINGTATTISWNTSEAANSTVEYGTTNSYGLSASQSINFGTTHSVTLTGLSKGTRYYYRVISADPSGNIAIEDHGGTGYEFSTLADTIPPAISSVSVALVSDTSAVITWITDEDSTSQVAYGTTADFGSESAVDESLTKSHSITLTGLAKSTAYRFKVLSSDAAGNDASDDNAGQGHAFTTAAEPGEVLIIRSKSPEADLTPPTIMNLRIGSISQNSAVIEWNTDEAADTIVKYGPTIAYGTLAGSVDEKIMAHQVNLSGLKAGTIYHFIAVSSDSSGNQAASADWAFATLREDGTVIPISPREQPQPSSEPAPDQTAPPEPEPPKETRASEQVLGVLNELLSDPELTSVPEDAFVRTVTEMIGKVVRAPAIVGIAPKVEVTGNSAEISWTTDKKASSVIAYSSEEEYRKSASNPYVAAASNPDEFSTFHKIKLENLLPATRYHFQVRSKGAVGGEAKSEDATFQTASELPVISGYAISETGYNSATLSWITNVPTKTEVTYRDSLTGEELTQGDTALLLDHKFKVTNLKPGSSYSFTVKATDVFGNSETGKTLTTVMSIDSAGPAIGKVSSDSTLYPGKDTKVQTIISWETDEPATSKVFYQEGLAKDAEVFELPTDDSLVTKHTVVVTKFRPSTVYEFWVESADGSGNVTRSNDFLILTPQQKASVLDVIIGNFEQVFGWTKKLQ